LFKRKKMNKSIFTLIFFSFLISFVFGEFQLMKRSRGYSEAVDYLTLKIKRTNCEEFLKKGGLAERISGGYSHQCLPINSKGIDVDDLKFVGRCINSDKHIILSVFEIHRKNHGKNEPIHNEKEIEFYFRLRSADEPLDYEVLHFNLKNGHSHESKRPFCLKARNHCHSKGNDEFMVIDCGREEILNRHLDRHETVYIEITRRNEKPDTCIDRKNGHCCRYVNANNKGGICKLYDSKINFYKDSSQQQQEYAKKKKF